MDSRLFDTAVVIASQNDVLAGRLPSVSSSYIDGNNVVLVSMDGEVISEISLTQILDYQAREQSPIDGNQESRSSDTGSEIEGDPFKSEDYLNLQGFESDLEIQERFPDLSGYITDEDVQAKYSHLCDAPEQFTRLQEFASSLQIFKNTPEPTAFDSESLALAHKRIAGKDIEDLSIQRVYILGKAFKYELAVFHDYKELALDKESYETAIRQYELDIENYEANMRAYEIARQQFELRRDLKRENEERRREAAWAQGKSYFGLGEMLEGIGDLIKAPKKPKKPKVPDQESFYKPLIPQRKELRTVHFTSNKFSSLAEFVGDKVPEISPRLAQLIDQSIQANIARLDLGELLVVSELLMREAQMVVACDKLPVADDFSRSIILGEMADQSREFHKDLVSISDEACGDSSVGFLLRSVQAHDIGLSLSVCFSISEEGDNKRFMTTVHPSFNPELTVATISGLIL